MYFTFLLFLHYVFDLVNIKTCFDNIIMVLQFLSGILLSDAEVVLIFVRMMRVPLVQE